MLVHIHPLENSIRSMQVMILTRIGEISLHQSATIADSCDFRSHAIDNFISPSFLDELETGALSCKDGRYRLEGRLNI